MVHFLRCSKRKRAFNFEVIVIGAPLKRRVSISIPIEAILVPVVDGTSSKLVDLDVPQVSSLILHTFFRIYKR